MSDPTTGSPAETEQTPYELMGGERFFTTLVARFYEGVATDEVLRPMYPEGDLAPAERRLRLFMEQYWGGPDTYGEERGHPRLRMRHAPYEIDMAARDRWLTHMRDALDSTVAEQPMHQAAYDALLTYLTGAATAMVNVMPEDQAGVTISDGQR
jgi:hemoglobin